MLIKACFLLYSDSVFRYAHMNCESNSILHDDGHEVVLVVALDVFQEGVQLVALVDQVEQDVFEIVFVHMILPLNKDCALIRSFLIDVAELIYHSNLQFLL